jgi:membrane dipeptidase
MMKFSKIALLCSLMALQAHTVQAADLKAEAQRIAQQYLLIDTHIDVPYRLQEHWEDVSQATAKGEFDYPRAKQGGLNAPFMSVYIPASYEKPVAAICWPTS